MALARHQRPGALTLEEARHPAPLRLVALRVVEDGDAFLRQRRHQLVVEHRVLLFVSVQRARLKGQASTQLIAERERGLKAMLESTDAERKRIAGELHDGVGQQLTGLKFRLEDVAARISERLPDEGPRMKEVLGLADEAGKDVRGIAHSMMPRALGDLGLAPALNDMLNKSLAH